MSQRFWTDEMLDILEDCLEKNETLAEAVNEFAILTNSIVSDEAARKALARHRNTTPSALRSSYVDSAVPPSQTKADENAINGLIDTLEKSVYLQSKEFEICVLYANKKSGGLDQSASQVAIHLNKERSDLNISEEDIKDFLTSLGQTKNTIPGHGFDDIQQTRELRESLKQRYLKVVQDVELREEYENLKKEYEELQAQTDNATKFLNVVEKLFANKEIEELPYDGTHFNLTACKKILTLPIADMHYGFKMLHEADELYDKEHHQSSKEIIEARVEHWRHNALNLIEMYKPSVVHYMGLGDDFESIFGNMRPNQWRDLDAYGFESWEGVLKLHALNILALLIDPNVEVLATFTPGNHDRVFEDRHMDSEDVISQMMCLYLKNHYALAPHIASKRLRIRSVPRTMSFNHSALQELNVIAYHGHLNKVMPTDKDIINAVYHHKSSNVNTKRHLLIQGHLHHFKAHQAQDCLAIWLPPITGTSDFGKNKILKTSPPQQIGIVSDKYSDIIVGPFNLC